MTVTVVPAVRCLFTQANQLAPARSRLSDGAVASAAHSRQNPTSDHEPDEHGDVYAGDLTDDDARGIDCRKIAAAIVAAQDRRVKYLISEGRMVSSYAVTKGGVHYPAWTWRPYTGSNGHFKHLHVSVLESGRNDTRPWPGLSPHAAKPKETAELNTAEKALLSQVAQDVEDIKAMFEAFVRPRDQDKVDHDPSAIDAGDILTKIEKETP